MKMLVIECCCGDVDVVVPVEHGSHVHRRKAAVSVKFDHVAGLPVDRVREALVQIGVHLGVMQRVRCLPSAFEVPSRLVPIAVVLYERPYPHLLAGAGDGRLPQKRFVQFGIVLAFVVVQRGKVLGIHAALERVGAWFRRRFCG